MTHIHIVGVGMTPFGRHLEHSVKSLTAMAVTAALKDAGIAKEAIETAYFANTTQGVLEGQHLVAGQMALRDMGFTGIPIANVENACASASTALNQAVLALRAGAADVALAVGADKMYTRDRVKDFEIFDGALDVHTRAETFAAIEAMGHGVAPTDGTPVESGRRSPFMDVYAAFAKCHMKHFSSTPRQFAAVSAKNHAHSAANPLSQFQNTYSVDEILAARTIAWPLTLPMCSPISDGAAAAILCTDDGLAKLTHAPKGADAAGRRKRSVCLLASVIGSGVNRTAEEFEKHITHLAARRAYDEAQLGPDEMDVAEVHDATAFGEVTQSENLGFCEFGDGGAIAERGETRLGGRIPINPSGGLESKGHPIGATGLGQIYELVTQLRGEAGPRQVENARHAIAENGGGIYGIEESTCCITILGQQP